MRSKSEITERGFEAKAISGTHAILIALNCPDKVRPGLMGFAFEREKLGGRSSPPKFLRSSKVFKSIVPDPKNARDPNDPAKPQAFYSDKFPVQSFFWGDYAATPGTTYRLRILPMFGKPGALTTDKKDEIKLEITTEKEWAAGETHRVWFNRGAIASQKFAEEFREPGAEKHQRSRRSGGQVVVARAAGRVPRFITQTRKGDALRVAAYEFTYPPILDALKGLIDKGIDVQIVYHDTTDAATGSRTRQR